MKEKYIRLIRIIIIILLLLLAFLIRIVPIRMSHFWDETVYLQHAEIFFSGRDNFNEFSFRPPLLSLLFFLGFFIKHSVVTASVITAGLGALAGLFIFLIGKKLYGFKVGIIAGLIYTFVPFMTLNSNYLLTDVPSITFMAISFYLSLFKDKKFLLFLGGVFFSFSILMKFTVILLGPIFILYFVIRKFKLNEIFLFFLGAFIAIFPYLLWAQIKLGNFLTPFIQGQGMVSDFNEPKFFYYFNLNKAFSFLTLVGLGLFLIFTIIKVKSKEYKHWKRDLLMLAWIAIFLLYLTKTPHKELRYLLPITIPIILLASCGIASFIEKVKKPYKVVIWILFIISLLYLASSTYAWDNMKRGMFVDYTITDEMKIADYLKETNYTGIIYSNQRWPVLAYYTGLETRLLFPYGAGFYSNISGIMKNNGLLIGMFGVKEPQPVWLDKDKHFKYVYEIGEFFIYNYTV